VNKLMPVPVIGIVLVCFIASFVTAFEGIPNSPLYAVRMEQASSKMHFMPRESYDYTYVAEQGYEMPYDVVYSGSAIPLSTALDTDCDNTCGDGCTVETCPATCLPTCPNTCMPPTCPTECGDTRAPDCPRVKLTIPNWGC
jgi:hypothetical protein